MRELAQGGEVVSRQGVPARSGHEITSRQGMGVRALRQGAKLRTQEGQEMNDDELKKRLDRIERTLEIILQVLVVVGLAAVLTLMK